MLGLINRINIDIDFTQLQFNIALITQQRAAFNGIARAQIFGYCWSIMGIFHPL